MRFKTYLLTSVFSLISLLAGMNLFAQGFMHAEGSKIIGNDGNEILLRGIGTGNWMIQEGYMMKWGDVAGTQHEFRERLVSTIGESKTDSFYRAWLHYHMQEIDIDSMKAWGFNSVRVNMHYLWFTPPIEDEPVAGQITWIETGFTLLDSLLDWCAKNEMYMILDLHGAPGGQGKEASISDYDENKLSLWESAGNKAKTVALWRKLAERYANEPWVGGYDLINETNWTFSTGNNAPLRELYGQITDAIREVDPNHMLFIEGNWFANDFSGLTPPWDDNMAYSFHKYWSTNGPGSLDYALWLRNDYNVPLWLGESGENSNTWFTNCIKLCEENNIGWSWWPLKKPGINNPLMVNVNPEYTALLNYWKNGGTAPTVDAAFEAVLKFSENHKLENCSFQKDVVDAMIRQPHTTELKPFRLFDALDTIFATDYAMGRNGYAYFDQDTGDYHGSTNVYTAWNQGYAYRNDGVDIEACTEKGNGYNVGWTSDDEFMVYTLQTDSAAAYTLDIRSASGGGGGTLLIEANGAAVCEPVKLPGTTGWQKWQTTSVNNVILPAGYVELKVIWQTGGSNLNYLRFRDPIAVSEVPFQFNYGKTNETGSSVAIALNKEVTSPETGITDSDFHLFINSTEAPAGEITLDPENGKILHLSNTAELDYGDVVELSYNGSSVLSGEQTLVAFEKKRIENFLPVRYTLPCKIEAEAFYTNSGLALENCEDTGGGLNTGYANPGDYLDYRIKVNESGYFLISYRVATARTNAEIIAQVGDGTTFVSVDTMKFAYTGGWQNWTTQSGLAWIDAGKYLFRIRVKQSEHNLNWIQFTKSTDVPFSAASSDLCMIFPNPADQFAVLSFNDTAQRPRELVLTDLRGRVLWQTKGSEYQYIIETGELAPGIYLVRASEGSRNSVIKLVIGK